MTNKIFCTKSYFKLDVWLQGVYKIVHFLYNSSLLYSQLEQRVRECCKGRLYLLYFVFLKDNHLFTSSMLYLLKKRYFKSHKRHPFPSITNIRLRIIFCDLTSLSLFCVLLNCVIYRVHNITITNNKVSKLKSHGFLSFISLFNI